MKQIKLTTGQITLVDDADFEWLNQWKWRAVGRADAWYAVRTHKNTDGKRTIVRMHRVIMGITDTNTHIDHINNDVLDNQKHNLRLCNNAENSRNKRKLSGTTSKYKGVHRQGEIWKSAIELDNKKKYLGAFDTEEQAAAAYNVAAKIYHGEFCFLNDVPADVLVPARIVPKTNTSGFLGVHRAKNRWAAQVSKKGEGGYIGSFATPEEAARARDAKALELFGPNVRLNFPVI